VAQFSVVLGGSRSLSAAALPLVSRVVGALAAAGASAWSVVCCWGGDALGQSAFRSAVSVIAVGGPGGGGALVGFWSGSVRVVVRAAGAGGRVVPLLALVRWLARGRPARCVLGLARVCALRGVSRPRRWRCSGAHVAVSVS
jgi:hypothetical protein